MPAIDSRQLGAMGTISFPRTFAIGDMRYVVTVLQGGCHSPNKAVRAFGGRVDRDEIILFSWRSVARHRLLFVATKTI